MEETRDQPTIDRRVGAVPVVTVGILMIATLAAMGRVWWCEAGDLVPWSWDVWSQHNSQHLVDPYSLSHLQHGIGMFLLLSLIAGSQLSIQWRVLIVAVIEAGWEIIENTPLIINRYREATISLDYYGDSILNSASDYVMCMIGVFVAAKLNWRVSVAIFVALELSSLLWIRDSLTLNILMLVYPLDVVRTWQAG